MSKGFHRVYIGSFVVTGIAAAALIAYFGLGYYSTALEERFFHPRHNLLKPSGDLGHGFGVVGSSMMLIGVSVYMLRKRVREFSRIGILKYWLEFHIFLCSTGPILVLYHTAFKFGGIVAVSFYSMAAVVLSGIIGRFIYVRIPRTIQGRELSIAELNEMNDEISIKLSEEYGLDSKILSDLDKFASFGGEESSKERSNPKNLLNDYFKDKKDLIKIKEQLIDAGISKDDISEIMKIAKSKMTLSRRIHFLRTFQEFFRYWHIIHLPFAIIMLVIMLIHVGVTVAFGYQWIF